MASDKNFDKIVNAIVERQKLLAKGMLGETGRVWFNFEEVEKVGRFDVGGLHTLFDRQDSNDLYGAVRAKASAVVKELHTLKISHDFLAGLERDTHARRRSRIRSFVHAAAKTEANSLPTGPLSVNTLGWLSRLEADKKVEAT